MCVCLWEIAITHCPASNCSSQSALNAVDIVRYWVTDFSPSTHSEPESQLQTHNGITMERILRGIMRYRRTTREQMVKEFVQVKNNPQASELYLSLDSFKSNLLLVHSRKRCFSRVWTRAWFRRDSQRHTSVTCLLVNIYCWHQSKIVTCFCWYFLLVFCDSSECGQFGAARATFSRWILYLWTGRIGIGLRCQQYPTHYRLWPQWL